MPEQVSVKALKPHKSPDGKSRSKDETYSLHPHFARMAAKKHLVTILEDAAPASAPEPAPAAPAAPASSFVDAEPEE